MSRARNRAEQLASVRDVRLLAERVAEARAAAALRASREQDACWRQESRLLESTLGDWHAALSVPGFDPAHAALFGQAVDRQHGSTRAAHGELERLRSDLDQARQTCKRAEAAQRCAADLLEHARRRHRRWREERDMAERDDGYGRRAARA